MDLDGKTALVTGASQNIGQAIAVRLAEAGADVGISAYSNEDGLEETKSLAEAEGVRVATCLGDLAEESEVHEIVSAVTDELGPIDILINNASIRPAKPFLEISTDDWARVHNVDLRAMFLLAQEVVPEMVNRGGGSIVNLLGMSVFFGMAGKNHVVTNKAGIEGLTRSLAVDFGPDGVRVNAIAVGTVDTTSKYSGKPEGLGGDQSALASLIPLRRRGEPEEIANAVCFLASPQASYITGQTIHVNGGIFPTVDIGQISRLIE